MGLGTAEIPASSGRSQTAGACRRKQDQRTPGHQSLLWCATQLWSQKATLPSGISQQGVTEPPDSWNIQRVQFWLYNCCASLHGRYAALFLSQGGNLHVSCSRESQRSDPQQ